MSKKIKVAINGFGRIGKCLTRILLDGVEDVELVAINCSAGEESLMHQLQYDSIHGRYNIPKSFDAVKIHSERDIAKLNWQDIDVVLECTGSFNSKEKASLHLKQGASRVLVSAPCDNADKTIIYGINEQHITKNDLVISTGSCTSNCFAPICWAMHKELGIENGFMTTIHSYTNDQRLLDGNHKDARRARAGAVSMIPTSTGATKIMAEIFPELKTRISGSCIRVPTSNVSVIDFTFTSQKSCNSKELLSIFQEYASSRLKGILTIENKPLVSVDFIGRSDSSIIDALETSVINDRFVRVLAWYDNEWGFSHRMIDVVKLLR
jgi:glyceraldehyde 3-phosphate dehydrogenase